MDPESYPAYWLYREILLPTDLPEVRCNDRQNSGSARDPAPLTVPKTYLLCNRCLLYQSHLRASADFSLLLSLIRRRSFPASLRYRFFDVRGFQLHRVHRRDRSAHTLYEVLWQQTLRSKFFRFPEVRQDIRSVLLHCRSMSLLPEIQGFSLLLSADRNGLLPKPLRLLPDQAVSHPFYPMEGPADFRYNPD